MEQRLVLSRAGHCAGIDWRVAAPATHTVKSFGEGEQYIWE